jgi:hypothetical protein
MPRLSKPIAVVGPAATATLRQIAGLLARESELASMSGTCEMLRALTGRRWRRVDAEKLIEDRELIVTDAEPPRVFAVTLDRYMRRIACPPREGLWLPPTG